MKIYKCGIVGTGMIADFHAAAILSQANASLAACADTNLARAEAFAKKHGGKAYQTYEEMLTKEKLDIITVATPSGLHMGPVIAAAAAGCHALCEKPIEIKLERINAMIAAHEKAGTQLGCIFQNRFVDAMEPLRKAISSGRFGKITYAGVYVPWWRSDDYYKGTWRGSLEIDGGGALMNQSIHMIDMLCELLPPIRHVHAFTGTLAHPIEAEDTAVATVRFEGGAVGVIYGATSSYPGQFKRFEITGTAGTAIYVENSFTVWQFAKMLPEDEIVQNKFGTISGLGGVADPKSIDSENHKRNLKAFIDAIDSGKKFHLDASEGRKAVALILAIYEAAKTGHIITL